MLSVSVRAIIITVIEQVHTGHAIKACAFKHIFKVRTAST